MPTLPALKVEDAGTQLYAPLSAASPIIPHSRSIPANGSNRSLSSASSTSSNSSARRDSAQLQIDSNGDNVNSGDGYGSRAEVNGTGYSGQSIRRTDSEETLNGNDPNVARSGTLRASQAGRGKGKGKAVVDQRGHWAYVDAWTADASAAGDVGDVGAGAGVGGYGYARDGERVQGARLGDDLNPARMERERKKVWDEEQGRVEEVYGNSGQYPPTNDEEEEERRIQDNLARMAARDQARRRAARTSRLYPADGDGDEAADESPPGSGFSSSTNYRRPTSAMGGLGRSGSKNGTNGMKGGFGGLVGGLWRAGAGGRGMERLDDEETLSRESSRQSYNNPYDPHPHPQQGSRIMPIRSDSSSSAAQLVPQANNADHRIHTSTLDRADPAYVLSPFADPDDIGHSASSPIDRRYAPEGSGTRAGANNRQQNNSGRGYTWESGDARPVSRVFPGFPDYEATQAARRDPAANGLSNGDETPPTGHTRTPSQIEQEQGFSYAGAGWKGGAGAGGRGYAQQRLGQGEQQAQATRAGARPKERWWHALCAWGNDLDGGHGQDPDGQVGRTNPYE